MSDEKIKNILKIREDAAYFVLEQTARGAAFSLGECQIAPSWYPVDKIGGSQPSDLRGFVEPWLTSLFQSEHLSLLIGSGLSTAVNYMATQTSGNPMAVPMFDSEYADKIMNRAKVIAEKNGRGEPNIEDYIRVINELICGLEVLGHDIATGEERNRYDQLLNNLKQIIGNFAEDISEVEYSIATAREEQRKEAFDYLVNFLMSFASRTGTRERLNLFTTNYDRVIEAGAEIAGLHLLDRFVGTLAPIFRSSRLDIDMHYNPPGIRGEPRYLEGVARFTKLHGSIDWINTGEHIRRIGLPFGSRDMPSLLNAPGLEDADSRRIMIYPNAAKDKETTEYPYVELFRDFAAAICRPNSTLVTYGYGFGDDHINRVIRDMLTIPSTHLVIISYGGAGGRIKEKYKEFGRPSQISLIIGSGLADLKILVDYFLPKPSIDRASIRMSELLKQRYSAPKEDVSKVVDGGSTIE
ncbi:MAG: fibronectin-binding protein (FBP) [Clostridiaceae bacterium]|jgi:hypothetical protein|nr:fibronectin-binding protein (FBP) [Clostridiaceae bacterium]